MASCGPRSRSPSRIPQRNLEHTNSNSTMKHYSNSPSPRPAGGPGRSPEKHHNHGGRVEPRRSSAVNYQAHQHQHQQSSSDLTNSYMPPQNSVKNSPYCTGRSSKQKSFDRDFGPFGTVAQGNADADVGDITSMYRRSEYRPIPCLMQQQQYCQEQQHQQQHRPTTPRPVNCMLPDVTVPIPQPPQHTGGVMMGGPSWQTEAMPNRTGNILIRSQLPPQNQPTVLSGGPPTMTSSQRSLRRNEDVDRILNKYGRSSRSNVRDMENNKDPDFANIGPDLYITTPEKYCKQQKLGTKGYQGYWDHQRSLTQDLITPQRRRNVQGHSSVDIPSEQVTTAGEAMGHYHQQQQQHPPVQHNMAGNNQQTQFSAPAGYTFKQSSHVFPFKEASDGHLLVEPSQIAFESRKLCVLMSDPNNNTTIEFSTNKVNSGVHLSGTPSKHERILHEVKRAMSIVETSENHVHGRSNPSLYTMRKHLNSCYSDSKKATEQFEQKVLLRMNCGKNADTHVMIGDNVFPCHSVALEAFSSYFDRLSRPPDNIQKVFLPENEVSADAFPIIMDWLVQSEEVRKGIPKKESLVSVYIAAKYLGVKELEAQCIQFMEYKVSPSDPDLLNIWDAVKRRQSLCPALVRIVASKMAASYREFYESKKYLQMEVDELFMLLSSDDVAIESEMDVYNSAVTWLIQDWKSRKIHTSKIMSTVRFGLLSPLQLTQISRCPEMTQVKGEKDFNQLLCFGTVKSMIDDGLSYSILDESYKTQPEELKKWVDKSGMKVPVPRTALLRKKLRGGPLVLEKISLLEDASHTKLMPSASTTSGRPVQKSSSYTLLNAEPRPETPHIVSRSATDYPEPYSTLLNAEPRPETPHIVSRSATDYPEPYSTLLKDNNSTNASTSVSKHAGNIIQRSKSRIPTKSNQGSCIRPPPPTQLSQVSSTTEKGTKRPATFEYQPGSGTVVHELSKPKILTTSSNGSDTEEGSEENTPSSREHSSENDHN